MRLKRALAFSLAALLALLAPGPQAWAAVAATAASTTGQSVPSARIAVLPASSAGSLSALPSSLSLDLGGRVSAAAPAVREAAPGVALTAAPLLAAQAGPAAVSLVPAAPAPVSLSAKLGASPSPVSSTAQTGARARASVLSESAAPLLADISKAETAPGGLRESGAKLQDVLQGLGRRDASADAVAAPAVSERGLTGGLSPAASPQSTGQAPVPQPGDGLRAQAKKNFGRYAFGVSAVKTGLDALNLAVPLILLDTFHAAMAVSALYLVAELARLISGTLGGAIIDRVGAGRALTLTVALQILATASLPFALLYGGALAMPLVFAVFVLNGVGYELFDVARRAALPQIVGKDEGVLRAQNGRLYVWREMAATAGVFGAGWVIKALGAVSTIWIHPIFCALAAVAMLSLWKLRPQDSARQPAVRERLSLRAWWSDLLSGMHQVFANRQLRSLVLINIPLTAVHKLFHTVVAVVFAAQVLGNPTFAAVLVGAWNLGELAGSFYLGRWGKNSHFSSWLRLAAVASLSMWAYYLLPIAWVAVAVSFLIAAAMIGNELGTASYMQSAVPEKSLGSVTGFVYGLSRAVGMLALVGAGWAFDALTAQGGFLVLALIFTGLAPIYLLAAKHFASEHMSNASAADTGD